MRELNKAFIIPLPPDSAACPYIKGERFYAEHFICENYLADDLDFFLNGGFRHFSDYFFRPVCGQCGKCLPIRMVMKDYVFSKSLRRVLKKNGDIEVREDKKIGTGHFKLYLSHKLKFGPEKEDFQSFANSFNPKNTASSILNYYLNGKLICASHFDIAEKSLSAVYTYYDTTLTNRSLGKYAVAKLIEKALALNKDYLYLGYYIPDNTHMNYKDNYYPNQICVSPGVWVQLRDKRNNQTFDGPLKFIT